MMMTGQRNENSVLFSLSSLQALASNAAPSGGSGKDEGDASGLIDIRTLASGTRGDRDGVDDLISIGGGGFAPSLGAPVLAAQRTGLSMGAKIGLIGGAFAVLAAIVVVAVVLLNKEEPKNDAAAVEMAKLQKQIQEMMKNGGGGSQKMADLQAQLNAKQSAAGGGAQAGAAAGGGTDTAGAAAADDKKAGKGAAAKGAGGGGAGKPKGDKEPGDKAPSKGDDLLGGGGGGDKPVAEKPASGKKNDELDDLLGGSLGGPSPKKDKPAEKPAEKPPSGGGGGGGGDLPDTLGRGDVQTGMNAVAGAVSKCAQGQSGSVTVRVVIGNAGRVQDAQTVGPLAGTPVGQCAARAVRTARFPKFKNPSLTVTYPFKL
jgi:TonB family protein